MSSGFPQQGYAQSLTLHLSIAGVVAALTLLKPFARKHEPVFEVFQIPLGTSDGAMSSSEPTPSFQLPDPPPPRPQPQQQRLLPPPPAPEVRPLPPPVTPRTSVAPPPAAAQPATPEPRRITREEYVRLHGEPQTRAPRTPRQAPPRAVPRIDTRFSVDLSDAIRSAGSLSGTAGVVPTAVNIYVAGLNDLLKQAWNNPQLALTTTVEFDVAPSGRLSNVRVTGRSGNTAFDESVLAAFRQVTSGGPTPEGRSLQLRFKFNGVAP